MRWFRPSVRVLFVCTANICRSPFAQGVLRHRLEAMGLAGLVQVRSAGSRVGHAGQRPDPRIQKLAADAGISLVGIRSRALTLKMLCRSDFVLVMERRHLEDIEQLVRASIVDGDASPISSATHAGGKEGGNVHLLGSFLPFQDGYVPDIPDPYFGDGQSFCDVQTLIDSALTGFLDCLDARLGKSRHS